MLRSTRDLEHDAIDASDGAIGHVKDFYFADTAWIVWYVMVETGSRLPSRKVLISPLSVLQPEWIDRTLAVSLTRDQVRNSPSVGTDKPVSMQHEENARRYDGIPSDSGGPGRCGDGCNPSAVVAGPCPDPSGREPETRAALLAERSPRRANDDPHLRSCNAVQGDHLLASDGRIGHVRGYHVDDQS